MKKINQKIITSIFIFFIVLLLSISMILANNVLGEEKVEINEEKIYYQIKYLDREIIYMSRLLNINETQINWEELLNHTNNLYNYWNSAILDLNNLDIDKKHLTNFSKELDEFTISIKYMNKREALVNLSKLYNKLIIYIDDLNYPNYQNILLTKNNLLLASSIIETGNWTLAHEHLVKASDNMYRVFNKIDINSYMQYNINQAYVAVKEMENIINIKDIDIFNIKYNIAIQKLENI